MNSRVDLNSSEMKAWRTFLAAHARLISALDEELVTGHGLPLADYEVLVHLSEGPADGIRMSQLAERILVSRSGLTRRVDRLEAAGLVERRVCPSDRRGQMAMLTPTGRRRLREAAPTHLEGVRRMFADALGPAELEALSTGLGEVLARAGGELGGATSDCG
jgi:DNA-binding MarR family transcriptional regulator